MVFTPDTLIRKVSSQSSSVLGNETIVLDYQAGNYYELNEMGGFIWSLFQTSQPLSADGIKEKMLDEFDVEESVCQEELMLFLANLFHEKLIEVAA